MSETSAEVIRRYLQDAITTGKNTETYLQKFADETGEAEPKQLFHQLALEAKKQQEKLTVRLASLGASPSAIHGLLSQLLGSGSKPSQVGYEKDHRTTHNLMAAFATEHAKAALYEAIANMSEAASDYDTAELARSLRDEASASAQKVWLVLSVSASETYGGSSGDQDYKRP